MDLEITEDFEENKTLAAGEFLTKAPSVKNTGTVKQLFFTKVYVPCMEAAFLDAEGNRLIPEGTTPTQATDYLQTDEVFNVVADGIPSKEYIISPGKTGANIDILHEFSYNAGKDSSTGTPAAGWIYLEKENTSPTHLTMKDGFQDGYYNIYRFAYNTWVDPDETTIPIFDQLQLRSIIDGDITGRTIGQINIDAYTLQAEELDISGLSGTGDPTDPYTGDDLKKLYVICQNKES